MFFTTFNSCSLRLFKLNTEGLEQYTENLMAKLQNLNRNFCVSWVSLIIL